MNVDLVVWDIFGTLVARGSLLGEVRPRAGMERLFNRYPHLPMAAATDSDWSSAQEYLSELGVLDRMRAVYVDEDMVEVPHVRDCGLRKDLERVCREMGVAPDRAVMISDGRSDKWQARRTGMRFVYVPQYVDTAEPFSFDLLRLDKYVPKYRDLRGVNPPNDVIP